MMNEETSGYKKSLEIFKERREKDINQLKAEKRAKKGYRRGWIDCKMEIVNFLEEGQYVSELIEIIRKL